MTISNQSGFGLFTLYQELTGARNTLMAYVKKVESLKVSLEEHADYEGQASFDQQDFVTNLNAVAEYVIANIPTIPETIQEEE